MTLTEQVKAEARRLGFSAVAVAEAAPAASHPFYRRWLEAGFAGAMGYLHRHAPLKAHPERLLPGARTVVAVTLHYRPPPQAAPGAAACGRVARYAWGADYHDVLRGKLERLGTFLAARARAELGREAAWRACVDTAPLMEREVAARAGLGWVGKHANLIAWEQGSWLFLGELVTDAPLEPDVPPAPRVADPAALLPLRESCGTCTACIEACPTQAIVADKTVDARRCIAYLTIELKGPVPADLRPAMGEWVFGCDVCQEVCPWNRAAPLTAEPAFRGGAEAAFPDLAALLALDEPGFRARFQGTALLRPRRRGLLRNACIALGNWLAARRSGPVTEAGAAGEPLRALRRALADPEPLVRGAAAWALGHGGGETARPWLREALAAEADPAVRQELSEALAGTPAPSSIPRRA